MSDQPDRHDNTTIRFRNSSREYHSIPRDLAQNRELTFEARGMLVYLLSKPADWMVQPKDLEQHCGRDRVYRILNELIEARYIFRTFVRDNNQVIQRVEYRIADSAIFGADGSISPLPEKPYTAEPFTANTDITSNTDSFVSKDTNTLFEKFQIDVPQSGFDQLRYTLAICLYESKDAAGVVANASRALKNLSGTAAKNGQPKQPGLLDYEKRRQNATKIDCTALANEVPAFVAWHRRTFPGRSLPLGVPELVTAWADWRGRTTKAATEPPPVPVVVPDDYGKVINNVVRTIPGGNR